MKKRFPAYRPSTALVDAMAALKIAQEKRRAAAAGEAADQPGQFPDMGGIPPCAAAAVGYRRSNTPGREDTDIGDAAEANRVLPEVDLCADIDALTSGRESDD